MQKMINNIGEENIYIVIAIIAVIIVALIIIIVIENISDKKYNSLENIKPTKEKKLKIKKEKELEDFEIPFEDEIPVIEEKPILEEESINEISHNNLSFVKEKKEELTYVTKEQTQEEAKKAIEEAAKKLVYDEQPDIIGPTFFEKTQEEQSIISYDELMKTNVYEILEDKKEIMDEGNEPITLDEIYNRDIINEEVMDEEEINLFETPTYMGTKDTFKASDVISPVFGVKREVVYQKEYNEFGETINIKELEVEIKKTEDFLKELKKLKNKLD